MKTFLSITVLFSIACVSVDGISAQVDPARYKIIVDRKPFGRQPVKSAVPVAEQPTDKVSANSPLRFLELVALTKEDSGVVRVGVFHAKEQYSDYLQKGGKASSKGFLVKDVDYDQKGALIVMGNKQKWIYMSDTVSYAPKPAAKAPSKAAPPASVGDKRKALLDRIRKNRAKRAGATPQTAPVVPELTDAQKAQRAEQLKKYQMDLIRAGGQKGPPLPLPLTPKMDKQLVKEGVLPPQE